jgi:DNA-binding NarL/FixJ family response regulator
MQVFQLLGRGYTTRQIAEEMNFGCETVQAFSTRLKTKLKLTSGTELLCEAIRWNDRRS